MQHRSIETEAGCFGSSPAKSHRSIPFLSLFVAALLLLIGSVGARADSQVRAVRLSNVSGTVQVFAGNETAFQQAYPNMPLSEGTRLEAGDDGRAEIQFEDGSVARLTPNSSLNLTQLRRDGSGMTVNDLEVLSGLAYFETGPDHRQQYTVHFGNVLATPAKATIFRVNVDSDPPEMAVLHGSVHAAGGTNYAIDVHQDQTVHFDVNDETRYNTVAGVTGDSWDEWNSDRDQALAAMSAQETREAQLNGGGAGWSDLDYYGNWYSMPGYGNVWSPNGAGPGWDPYGSGYWGFYQGAGYQWISGNPWGWLPYRCGAWNYFNNYGWGWSPNSCGGGNAWNFYGNGFGGGGGGIFIGGAVPKNYRLPERPVRPHPVAPGANLPNRPVNLITVNRGADASRLEPRPVGVREPARVAQVGGQKVTALPKSFNSTPRGPAGVVPLAANPAGNASAGRTGYVPVMRPYGGPVAPSSAPSANVYTARPAGSPQPSNGGQFHGGAPSASSSGSSHMGGGSSGSSHVGGGSSAASSAPAASHGGGGGGGPAPSGGSTHR
jgi:hypothetical protein